MRKYLITTLITYSAIITLFFVLCLRFGYQGEFVNCEPSLEDEGYFNHFRYYAQHPNPQLEDQPPEHISRDPYGSTNPSGMVQFNHHDTEDSE